MLGYRNSIGKYHKRVVEVPSGAALPTANNIATVVPQFSTGFALLGGDHSVTYGVVKGLSQPFVVLFDAHHDEYTTVDHLDCSNWLRLARADNLVSGVKWYGARDKSLLNSTNTMPIPKEGHVHITVDIDALDPSEYGWATTYPERNGLRLDEMLDRIRKVRSSTRATITADLVEYDAFADPTKAGVHAVSQILDALLECIEA